MTLSRLFDPRDRGLLLALARDPEGRPAAFCQYVPATGIDGYSLDVMRRAEAVGRTRNQPNGDGPAHPNGLSEYLVVKTIEHLREEGHLGLALHFATMRAVLAGESGSRVWHRLLSKLIRRLSADVQIETLWRFNAKFDPAWLPRYLVLDRPESTLHAGLAIVRLESLWELPIIGRLIRPDLNSSSAGSDAVVAPPGEALPTADGPIIIGVG
jgi:lysyl-tRNA synthetase class 2